MIDGVDPGTGIVTGNQPHDMTYGQANNVLRQEPDGSEVNRTYTARGQLQIIALGTATIDTLTITVAG